MNKLKRDVMRRYRVVKKFSTVLEARLAEEALQIHHIKAVIVRNYKNTHERFHERVREIYVLVFPQDYTQAYRLLYSGI